MGLQTFDETTPAIAAFPVTSSNAAGNWLDIAAPAVVPLRIDTITLANSDTILHNMELSILQGSTRGIVGTAQVPAGAGYTSVPPVFPFGILLPVGVSGIALPVGAHLQITNAETIGAGKEIDIVAFGGSL